MIYDNIAIIKDNKTHFKYTNIVNSVYIYFLLALVAQWLEH